MSYLPSYLTFRVTIGQRVILNTALFWDNHSHQTCFFKTSFKHTLTTFIQIPLTIHENVCRCQVSTCTCLPCLRMCLSRSMNTSPFSFKTHMNKNGLKYEYKNIRISIIPMRMYSSMSTDLLS